MQLSYETVAACGLLMLATIVVVHASEEATTAAAAAASKEPALKTYKRLIPADVLRGEFLIGMVGSFRKIATGRFCLIHVDVARRFFRCPFPKGRVLVFFFPNMS